MAEAALFIGWAEVARGRDKRTLDVYNDSLQYDGRLQQEGPIERAQLIADGLRVTDAFVDEGSLK